jgi:hypothetical protein
LLHVHQKGYVHSSSYEKKGLNIKVDETGKKNKKEHVIIEIIMGYK